MLFRALFRMARRARRDERGFALPSVFALGMVMLLLATTALAVATSGLLKTRTDNDWQAALAAAYAGIEDYQARLSNDSQYYRYGNPAAPFTVAAGSASTVALPSTTNAAFGIGTSGTWATIPAVSGQTGSAYRYEVNNKDYLTTGLVKVRSTGRSGSVTRSVVAELKQNGFLNYLYFTDYEVQDPDYSGVTAVDSSGKSVCERHLYDTPTRDAACGTIQFGPNDNFAGPVRTNDTMTVCGSNFGSTVISSNPTTPFLVTPSGCGLTATYATPAVYDAPIAMPPTNTQLKTETRNDLPAAVPSPGCLYTGPTVIKFEVVSGVGKMRVMSPWTKYTNIASTSAGASNPAKCGTPGSGTNGLGSTTGALIDVLDLNLVYIQAVPAAGSGDPNAPSSSSALPTNFQCTSGGWSLSTTSFLIFTTYYARFPTGNERTPNGASGLVHYGCRAGDLYVEGTVKGRTSLAAENYIYVTGDLVYSSRSSDLLGLIGQNAVFVWNPLNSFNQSLLGDSGREIDAAILSVGHTFQVQNYDDGPNRGTLTIFGAIAQKYRGTVATSSGSTIVTGYLKDYQYDTRLQSISPPKFLAPASATFTASNYAEVDPGYLASGATAP